MNEITYPVILTYEDDTIYIGIPDFNADNYVSFADNLDEVIKSSKELITLYYTDLEDNGKDIPKPSDIRDLKKNLKENQEIIYVSLWLPYEKSLVKVAYKKKTLSIPTWLDMLATQKNINFSQVLQEALKEKLDIK